MKQASEKRDAMVDCAWLVLLIALTSWWCVHSARFMSATFDEPMYLEYGMAHWHTGSYKALMKVGTMPLPVDVETLPLHLWERAHGVQIDWKSEEWKQQVDWLITWMRMGTLLFWAILIVYVYRIGRSLGGPWAGRIASAIVAFEPAFIAHASLATTDISVTAMLMVFVYEFRAGRGKGWLRRIGIPAVLYGVAILAKASALVFAPLFMVVIETHQLWTSEDFSKVAADFKSRAFFFRDRLWQFRREFFAIIGIGLAVTFLYCGSDWGTEPTFVTWAQSLPPGKSHDIMLFVSEHLKIFTNAGEGIVQQIKHNMRGHPTYILGEMHKRAVWYYFPLTLTIKCTIPFLLLPVFIAVARRRALLNWPLLCALVLFAYSVTCRVQIGIRFMLPLMALAAAGYGPAIVQALHEASARWKKTMLATFTAVGIIFAGAATLDARQDAICYTNEFWGGTANGYYYLSDSNYDWGQGLKELEAWRLANKVDVVDVCYFGLDPRGHVPPYRTLPLNDTTFVNNRPWDEVFKGKLVAVSTTVLYGPYLNPTGTAAADYLKQRKPLDRTMTFLIYDFR